MMKLIVVYESATGFTKEYAEWIAKALNCESKPLKNTNKEELQQFDYVIFGGWIMGNNIMGLQKIREMVKTDVVFAVGATPEYEEVIEAIVLQNNIGNLPFFYMEGGIRMEELGFFRRTLLKGLAKAVAKKENPSRQEEFMAKNLGNSFSCANEKQIDGLVEFVNGGYHNK